jgi:protein-disulfide isomerase
MEISNIIMRVVANGAAGLRGTIASLLVASVALVSCDSGTSDNTVISGDYTFEIRDDDLVIGSADAKNIFVEYSSMTCPHCAAFHRDVFPTLKEKYLDTGQAKFVFRHYPLDAYAAQASLLIKCAPDSKKLALIDAIYLGQRIWTQDPDGPTTGLTKIGREAMISEDAFVQCARDEANIEWLQRQSDEAQGTYEVRATPTIFLNGGKAEIRTVADLDRIMADLVGTAE